MKKLLLGLGAIAAIVTPAASVVACGNTTDNTKEINSMKQLEIAYINGSEATSAEKEKDIAEVNAAKSLSELNDLMEVWKSEFAEPGTTEISKNIVIKTMGDLTLRAINMIDDTNKDQLLVDVNVKVVDFIHGEGFEVAYDEPTVKREVAFAADGFISDAKTPEGFTGFSGTPKEGFSPYTGIKLIWEQADSNGWLAFDEGTFITRNNKSDDAAFETQLNRVVKAAWNKLTK